MRLGPDVLQSFRDNAEGWQSRIDLALKDWLKSHLAARTVASGSPNRAKVGTGWSRWLIVPDRPSLPRHKAQRAGLRS